jgi:arylsulfatase A-like enzyme
MLRIALLLLGSLVAITAIVVFLLRSERSTFHRGPITLHHPGAAAPIAETKRPNVVWILLDCLRAQNLAAYGYPRETAPTISSLARQGVVFEQHYAQDFWTFPSVPSYMTGRYFAANCLDSGKWQDQMRQPAPGEVLAPAIFRDHGYATYLVCNHSWFTPFSRLWQAFDQAAFYFDYAARITEMLDQNGTKPFFLYVHMLETHFPHRFGPPYDQWIDKNHVSTTIIDGNQPAPPEQPFSEADRELLRGLYDGGILLGDSKVREILDLLAERGLLDNTLVLVSSDHGEALGEDGRSVGHNIICEEVMHVPLILCGPGVPKGKRIRSMTENVDIVPTLGGLLGLKTDAKFDGRDLSAAWRPQAEPAFVHRDFVLGRAMNSVDSPMLLLRDATHAYLHYPVTGKGLLYKAPFSIASLEDLSAREPETAAAMKARTVELLEGKWREFTSLPELPPTQPFMMQTCTLDPPDAYMDDGDASMEEHSEVPAGQWLRILDGDGIFADTRKQPPPIKVHYDVPAGRYGVSLCMEVNPQWGPFPLHLFNVSVMSSPALISVEAKQWRECAYLGEFEVGDGGFDLLIYPKNDVPREFYIGKALFEPKLGNANAENPAILFDRQESLRALGYF